MRGDRIKPRPAYIKRPLTYDTNKALPFQRGLFQHGAFYDGNGFPSLLSSHSGRLFRVDLQTFHVTEITPIKQAVVNTSADFAIPNVGGSVQVEINQAKTTTTADFTVPLVGSTVQIHVVSTSPYYFAPSFNSGVTVGTTSLTVVSVDSATLMTVRNDTLAQVGVVVTHPATVIFATVPTVPLYQELPAIVIGGYTLTILTIDSPTLVTVQNNVASQVGITVHHPAAVQFDTYDVNTAELPLNWSIQAENYWILQDNQNAAVIYDGASSRRSNLGNTEIPVGNVMCYAMGRITVGLPDRQTFRVGDLVFGASGTPANGYRDAILRFTENDYLNEGGDFVARVFGGPSNAGIILAMKASAMTDTQLGQGPMTVGTPYTVFSLSLPFDRTTWKNQSSALQTVNPINGPLGQNSTVLINGDLWYRSVDGIRSYVMAQRQFTTWGNTVQSNELGDLLNADTQRLLEYGSGVFFGNRLLMTVSPGQSIRGVYHRGLVSLDFNLISSLRKKEPPAWEGVWSGLRILQIVRAMVNGQERCFMYVVNADDHIELWEIVEGSMFDYNNTPIQWSFQLPSYTCGDADRFKRLEQARIVINNLVGTLTGSVSFRNDLAPCYYPWDSFNVCAKKEDCGPWPNCTQPVTYREQERTPIKLRTPPDTFDTIAGRKARTGYEFQSRLELTGYGEISRFVLYCIDEPENLNAERNQS